MNNVTLVGRLTADPVLRFLPVNGTAVCSFTLAIDKDVSREKKQELEQRGKQTADFPRIVVWANQAEHCARYLRKGRLVAIKGRLQTRAYNNNDGKRVFVTEVVAEQVQFLEWGNNNNENINSHNDIDGFQPVDDDDIPF
ncbi:MAG: single-stranded DNA-binding protein [Firmicutes bacterium]|nr:single-stranded DNA-binding protein [Bacillota bacterium]